MKGYSTFPKALALMKPLYQIAKFHIQATRWECLTLLQRFSWSSRLKGLGLLQWCGWWILQTQRNGLLSKFRNMHAILQIDLTVQFIWPVFCQVSFVKHFPLQNAFFYAEWKPVSLTYPFAIIQKKYMNICIICLTDTNKHYTVGIRIIARVQWN